MELQKNKALLVGSFIALIFFVVGIIFAFCNLIGMPVVKGFQSIIYPPIFITIGFGIMLVAQLIAKKQMNKK